MFEDLKWTALLADDLLFEKVMTLSTQQKITVKQGRIQGVSRVSHDTVRFF